MFEEIFTAPFTRQRHHNAALLQQRLAFLQSYRQAGATRHTLRQMAERLLRLAEHAPEPTTEGMNDAQLQRLVDSTWPSQLRVSYRRRIELEAKRWFEFLGWWRRPDTTPMDPALARFIDWMRHERGLSDNTIASWTRWTGHFLRWCQSHGLTLDALQPQHLDNYLSTYQASGWNRRSVGFIVAMMRVFLRQAASRGECADTLAGSIFGPRVYSLEGIPASLSWDEVLQVLATANGSSEQDIRDRAILMLMAIYGLRRGEIVALRLDQIDWAGQKLHIWRLKRRQPQVYPLVPAVAQALARYIDQVRPAVADPAVFITLKAPRKSMPPQTLYELVRQRLRTIGIDRPKMGPHALRHACASRMLAQGLSLKEIGDHLGHSSTQATTAYAKVDMTALRAVAAFDLGGVQ
ncbi:MAG: tyrosine-type recombinase/integrase [Acidovorax defluvii]